MPNAIIIVDPISTGRVLASKAINRGLNVIALWTQGSVFCQSVLGECDALPFVGHVKQLADDSIEEIILKIKALPFTITMCTVGCESGVELTDAVCARLGLKGNGEDLSGARRDKYQMTERIREHGLRATKQSVVCSLAEIEEFVTREKLTKFVLKPRRSAATDGVSMCSSMDDAREKFDYILQRKTIFGDKNTDALIQEFMVGTEYVLDTVSCDGEHKVVAIWQYNKVPENGSEFVYHDMHLLANGPRERVLAEYVFGCLDALGVKWGAGHIEVMWLTEEDAPCLVEAGTRPHGAGGNFPAMTNPVYGYDQLDVTLDAMLDPPLFAKYPVIPVELVGLGVQYFFVHHEEGVLESLDLSFLETLQSYLGVDMHYKIGQKIPKTVDMCSATGIVRLAHSDRSVVERERDLLRNKEKQFFVIKEPPTAMVIVDPISTGRVLASMAIDRGQNVIAVWTQGSIFCQSLLGACDSLPFVGHVYEGKGESTVDVVEKLKVLPYNITSCSVGCESGVELNDALSSWFGLPGNGEDLSEARRDKWQMTERIRECGLRATKQAVVSCMNDIEEFVNQENLSKFVLKPRRSAATDGVRMCNSLEDAREKFEYILTRKTIFGDDNTDALIQEFMVGIEYVIDTVSCHGEHKVVAIWEYTKVPENGSEFVYHHMHLHADGPRERKLADYVFACLDALGIKEGAGHIEVMWLTDEDAPCLVEAGARPHGAGGNFPAMTTPVYGYNQLEVMLDAIIDPSSFAKYPSIPVSLNGLGVQYFFVHHAEGVLESIDFSLLEGLQSYLGCDWHYKVGGPIGKTVDMCSATGIVRLAHYDRAVVEREVAYLRVAEKRMFNISPLPATPQNDTAKSFPPVALNENVAATLLTH